MQNACESHYGGPSEQTRRLLRAELQHRTQISAPWLTARLTSPQ